MKEKPSDIPESFVPLEDLQKKKRAQYTADIKRALSQQFFPKKQSSVEAHGKHRLRKYFPTEQQVQSAEVFEGDTREGITELSVCMQIPYAPTPFSKGTIDHVNEEIQFDCEAKIKRISSDNKALIFLLAAGLVISCGALWQNAEKNRRTSKYSATNTRTDNYDSKPVTDGTWNQLPIIPPPSYQHWQSYPLYPQENLPHTSYEPLNYQFLETQNKKGPRPSRGKQ